MFDDRGMARQRPADLEVLPVDDPLRTGNLATLHRVVDRLDSFVLRESRREEALYPVADHELVVEAHEEARFARITLSSRAAAKLKIHATAAAKSNSRGGGAGCGARDRASRGPASDEGTAA